jgi:hypothetical protein
MSKPTDFTNFSTEHPNYFPGQFLLEEDFELQHKYLSDRQRYYNQALHVSGIIEGLEVEAINGKKAVKIKMGSAINNNGELIVIKQDIPSFDVFNNLTSGELYIEYLEEKKVQQQQDVADSYTRWQENPKVGFAATSPANSIKLAKLTIGDTVTIDVSIREYSGLSLPNSNNTALTLRSGGNANPNLAILTGSLKINGSLVTNGDIIGANLSLALDHVSRGTLFLATARDYNHALYNNVFNNDQEGQWDGAKWNVCQGLNIRIGSGKNKRTALYIHNNGNVGIGTAEPGNYKLNVQGDQYIKGSLTIQEGNFNIDGTKQIIFSDVGTTNALKIQLWNGYGFGINPSTLFYTASGNHSWRDENSTERMLLTTGANGGLTVKGTGTSSFAGSLTVTGSLSVGVYAESTTNIDLSGHIQLKEYGKDKIAYLQARDDNSNRDIGLRIRTQRQGDSNSTRPVLVDALTIQPNGDLTVNGDFQCSNGAITNILAIGDAPPTGDRGGNREWMKKGAKICLSSDMLFIGLKEEKGNDRKDAVIAWGDDPDDDFRFIHVQHNIPGDGKEVFRIKGNGNVGIGTNTPTAKLEVQGGITKLQQEEWQTPTFQNNWVNYENTYALAGYFKDSLGIVHLRGLVRSGTNNSTIFTLPFGYRPVNRELHAAATYGKINNVDSSTFARVDILADGQVVVVTGSSGWLSLDGITFRAA